MRDICRVSTILFVMMFFVSQADAQITKTIDLMDTVPLQEVTCVCVHVENLGPSTDNNGQHKEQVKDAVELKLKKAGIKILTEAEYEKTPGSSYLFINVNSFQRASSSLLQGSSRTTFGELHNFSIHVSVKQDVYTQKDLKVNGEFTRISAPTWQKTLQGSSARIESIQNTINNMVDLFIHDCLAVNAIRK